MRVLGLPPFALGEEFPPLVLRVSTEETFPRLALNLSAGGISAPLLTTRIQYERRVRLVSPLSNATAILARRQRLVARGNGRHVRKT